MEEDKNGLNEDVGAFYIANSIFFGFIIVATFCWFGNSIKAGFTMLIYAAICSPFVTKKVIESGKLGKFTKLILFLIHCFLFFVVIAVGTGDSRNSDVETAPNFQQSQIVAEVTEPQTEVLAVETEINETAPEPSESPTSPEPTTEAETIPETTEPPTEDVTEPEMVSLEIYNENGVIITYTGITDGLFGKEINFTLENHSGAYYDFMTDELFINGVESYGGVFLSAEDGETVSDYISIYDEDLPEDGLQTLEFVFEIGDDSFNTSKTAPIKIDLTSNSVEIEQLPETEPVPEVGKSVDTLVAFSYNGAVRNDVTGNWYCAVCADNVNFAEYAVSYYNRYMHSGEIHAICNPLYGTTTKIVDAIDPDKIALTVYKYVQGEEHDAKLMFGGDVIAYYMVDRNTGEITEE